MSGSSSNADSDSTPPSSAPSELVAQLPSPFYPPSLSKRPLAEIDTNNEQRSLSRKFSALPPVPLEEQVKEVLPDDKSVLFHPACSQLKRVLIGIRRTIGLPEIPGLSA